jgi:hypothetical protein
MKLSERISKVYLQCHGCGKLIIENTIEIIRNDGQHKYYHPKCFHDSDDYDFG